MKNLQSHLFLAAATAVLLSLAACEEMPTTTPPTQNGESTTMEPTIEHPVEGTVPVDTKVITIENSAFNPVKTTVAKGSTITWFNQDAMAHTVTGNDEAALESGELATGGSFAYTFSSPGTYEYHCKLHPGMQGSIVVTP